MAVVRWQLNTETRKFDFMHINWILDIIPMGAKRKYYTNTQAYVHTYMQRWLLLRKARRRSSLLFIMRENGVLFRFESLKIKMFYYAGNLIFTQCMEYQRQKCLRFWPCNNYYFCDQESVFTLLGIGDVYFRILFGFYFVSDISHK